jgi:vitamin B12 transporter
MARALFSMAWVLAAAGALVAAPVAAQEATSEEPVAQRIDPIVQIGTKIDTPVADVPSAVTVISGEEIVNKRYTNVGDALRAVPGVQIQSAGGLGKLTTVRIRGAAPNKVQVLVDGARVDSPSQGDFDFSDISPDLIDRVEIMRGAQSTLYGADAIGGVINIITKRGSGEPLSATLSGEGGNYSYYRGRLAALGSYKLLDYSAFGSLFGFSGPGDNNDSNQRAFGGQVGVTLPGDARLSLSGRYAKSSADLPIDTAIPLVRDPDSQQQSELTTLTLQLAQKPFAWWEYRVALHGLLNNLGFQDGPQPTPAFGSVRSQIKTSRAEIEVVNAFRPVPWNTLILGVEHRQERGSNQSTFVLDDVVSTTDFARTLKNTALFVQDELTILERFVLSGGVRYDINEPYQNKLTGRAGAVVLIGEIGSRLRGAWAQGFRAPTINDLFFPGGSNPDLEPEESTSWEIGVDQKLWRGRIRLGATYFNTRFTNLIEFDLATFQPVNVGRARAQGVEVTAEVDLLDWLVMNMNYTYTHTDNLDTGDPLRRFAPSVFNFGVTAEPVRRLSIYAQMYVVSSQFEAPDVTNPGYVRVDIGGAYSLLSRQGHWPGLGIYARIQNLLNKRYTEVAGFPMPGINALVGLQLSY